MSKKNRLKKIGKRLASYSAAAAATTATAGTANAAEQVWDIVDVTTNSNSRGTTFNMVTGEAVDATYNMQWSFFAEGYFRLHPASAGYFYGPAYTAASPRTVLGFIGTETPYAYITPLDAGTSIKASDNFVIDGPWYRNYYGYLDFNDGQTGMVGIRFKLGENTHYGWAEITRVDVENFTLHGFGYNDSPDGTSVTPELGTVDIPLDTNVDKLVDSTDIDAIYHDPAFGGPALEQLKHTDHNRDLSIDVSDVDAWLADFGTVRGDANLDGDVDVFAIDGSGDAQVLTANLGTSTGATWAQGDFNGDGDVDVFAIDGSGDAQTLTANLGTGADIGPDAAPDTAESLYNAATGELFFDVGANVGVVGIGAPGLKHGDVKTDSIFGPPAQNGDGLLAFFSAAGLPVGEDSLGLALPPGLTQDDLVFSYTPNGGETTFVDVTIIPVPEPSSILLLAAGAAGLGLWRRRRSDKTK